MAAFLGAKQLISRARPVLSAGVLLSLGIGGVFYWAASQTIEYDAGERFLHQAQNAQYNINSRINAYTDVLRGAASYFHAAGQVDRASFHRYVSGLDIEHQFPALDNINYAQYVTAASRAAFERSLRAGPAETALGYPERPALSPPEPRAEYWVLTMIEPLAEFREKIGRDIGFRAPVARALAQGRDHGSLSASGTPIDSVHQPAGAGLALRLPVYRNGLPLTTAEERRDACIGSVGIGFSVPRLVQAALEQIQVRDARLVLYDSGDTHGNTQQPQQQPVRLFDSQPHGPALRPGDLFNVVLPIDFNGRHWNAYFSAPKASWYSRFDTWLPWLAMGCGFTGSLLFFLLFHTLSSSRMRAVKMAKEMTRELRNSQARLQQSHLRLRRLAAHADQIKEQERKRIAREIHDDLGQNLLVLRIDVDMLCTRTRHRHPRLHARAQHMLGQIDRTIKSVRHIINDLRPTVLDLGLNAAVEWQIAQFRQRSGMVCELVEHQPDIRIDDHCATAFFRVLQESLSNILQHANASLVRVDLRQDDGMLSMTISDNGVGLPHASRHKAGSFGLVGIEERISLLGGRCAITSSPNGGTTVAIAVPLSKRAAPATDDQLDFAV
ncbi:Signal transduction histidine kinase [Duganella sp. CF402]|uniref:sensor histidine kinase n=1 Tax=unclassified Duganella TaxID=2636909 RepID=UPI0008C0770F|nr:MULTISPECIES: CHASE domain-containing protein [unclassified Duganella]RZT04357.1 signal transduction histidine kinase [Duganella sp. BK701]SEM39168.1 Signal transduction histidine kinase [Duganella sp. CF402]